MVHSLNIIHRCLNPLEPFIYICKEAQCMILYIGEELPITSYSDCRCLQSWTLSYDKNRICDWEASATFGFCGKVWVFASDGAPNHHLHFCHRWLLIGHAFPLCLQLLLLNMCLHALHLITFKFCDWQVSKSIIFFTFWVVKPGLHFAKLGDTLYFKHSSICIHLWMPEMKCFENILFDEFCITELGIIL